MKWCVILGFLLSSLPAGAQIVIGPSSLPTGQVNTPYSQQLTASGGTGPYTFTQISGSLPLGSPAFSISSAGVISGTPDGCASFVATPWAPCPNATEPMNSTFTVLATDSLGATGTQTYTIGAYWNPTEASFLTTFAGYDANMLAGVNSPPPVLLGGHLSPANPVFRQMSTDNQSTWNAWVDGIHASGATILSIEPDLDCVFNNVTSCQALYAGAISHARSLGMSISLHPAYYTNKSCGGAGCSPAGPSTGLAADCQALIGHGINASPGNGVSDWYACVTTPIPGLGVSAYQWMISHWLSNGDRFVPVHEPTTMAVRWGEGVSTSGCSTALNPPTSDIACYGQSEAGTASSGNTCPVDWWLNFLKPLFNPQNGLIPAWTASAGIGIHTGVTTFITEEQFSPGQQDASYATVFAKNLPASVDMGLDMFVFSATDLSVYEAVIAVAHDYHHQVYVDEFDRQVWVQSGVAASEACAIKGCYSCDWQTSQSDQNFLAAFLPFLASHGVISASLFPAQILAGCSVSFPDNCLDGSIIAAASANFLSGNRSAVSQKLESIMIPGPGQPATISITAGNGQSTDVGQAFPTALAVTVADSIGDPVMSANVTFTVTPGPTGAGAIFSWTGPAMIATGQNGSATAPALTANGVPGQFTITATVNGLTATFNLANLGYSLGAGSATVGSSAGNGTILLSGYGPWTASSNAPWLQLAAASASGNSSELIQFSYSANVNPGVQTGILTIAGMPFTVTQAGAGYAPVYPVTTLVSSGLNLPQATAVDALGNVYIADTANNAVEQLNITTGQFTPLVVSGLNAPAGVAVDSHGNVYIADTGNNAVREWIASAHQVSTLVASGLSGPIGLAVDAQDNVYIADSGNHSVKQWNAASQQVNVLVDSGLITPAAVAVDVQGNVYIADSANNALLEWSGGQLSTLVSGLSRPTGVAVDGQGNVYTADTGNNALKQWSAATQQVTALVSSGLKRPAGLAVDGSGNIYLADTNNSAIKELTPAYLALTPNSLTEASQAGTDSVAAQVLQAGTPLSATTDQPWLTASGVAGGTLKFSFAANSSSTSRTGHIVVLGPEVTVTQNGLAAQTITFGALSNQAFGTIPFTVGATASSGLAVSFASTTPAVCAVSAATATLAGVGTCTIQATQGGNSNWAAATPVIQSFQVTQGSQTIAFATLSNQHLGTPPFTVSATASSGLPVSFTSTSAVCTISGATVTLAAVGTCTIQAEQAGNANWAAATAVNRSFPITQESQTITFAALSSQAVGSAPFTVAATASSGLAVSFASTTSAVCTVSGATVTLVAPGTCIIQATQPGNTNYAEATPVGRAFQVTQESQTITFGSLSNQTFGTAPFTVTATASSGLTVSFASTTSAVCTVSGTTVTLVAAGTCTIQATQPGNTDYAAAALVSRSFGVTHGSQTITFGALSNQAFGAAPFTVSATASSGLAAGFASANPSICTVSGATVTLVAVGNCTIQASQAGNANWGPATPVNQSFQVTKGSQTIAFGTLSNQTMGAAPFQVSASATSGLAVSFNSQTTKLCTVSGTTVTLVAAGTCTIQATQAGNSNWAAAAPVNQSFQIAQ